MKAIVTCLVIAILLLAACVGFALTGIWSADSVFADNCADSAIVFGLLALGSLLCFACAAAGDGY